MEREQLESAFDEAAKTIKKTDELIKSILPVISCRLRVSTCNGSMSWYTRQALNSLKKELKDWDMVRGTWK